MQYDNLFKIPIESWRTIPLKGPVDIWHYMTSAISAYYLLFSSYPHRKSHELNGTQEPYVLLNGRLRNHWLTLGPTKLCHGMLWLLANYSLRTHRHSYLRLWHLLQSEPTTTVSRSSRLQFHTESRTQRIRLAIPLLSNMLVWTVDWRTLQPSCYNRLHYEKGLCDLS